VTIAERWAEVLGRVERAAERAGRDPSEVTVIAVSKTFPADAIVEALEAGATDIGENRAQELRDKMSVLGDRARWHFVGHLQTNKVRALAGRVALVHSVDRFGLGEAIARRAAAIGATQEVLIEVNLGGEAAKAGVEPPRAAALAAEVDALEGVSVRGLMAIPPAEKDPERARGYFKELAALRDDVVRNVPSATGLSMGMTRDFEVAIEEGATWIRVGEAIFGPRAPR
jgi:pyridoxal phosphate enzyme (YggS family)